MSELDRVHELLAFHAQGVLRGDDLAFMNFWLERNGRDHPEIMAEVVWLRGTSAQLQAQAETQTRLNQQTSNAGLTALMERIAFERGGDKAASSGRVRDLNAQPTVRPSRSKGSDQMTLSSRIRRWLDEVVGIRSPALALSMMVLVIGQAGVIGILLSEPPASQAPLSSAPASVPVSQGQKILAVAFRPVATESAIRTVLAKSGAQIIAGPSALGLYTVAVPATNADIVEAQLRAAVEVVESVQR